MLQTQPDDIPALQINRIVLIKFELIPSPKGARAQGEDHLEHVAPREVRWCGRKVHRFGVRASIGERQGAFAARVYEVSDKDGRVVQTPTPDEEALGKVNLRGC